MKKIAIVNFCLFSFSFAYSQSGIDSDCMLNLENIFKVHVLKIRYEAVQSLYKEIEQKRRFPKDSYFLNSYFELIRGFSLNHEKRSDTICSVNHGVLLEVEWLSDEELNRYIEQLNCTPEEALREYRVLIQNIKNEMEVYLNCIDTELGKGDLSEFAKDGMIYNFIAPGMSIIGLPWNFTKLDFLKVFKEFVINDNEEVLPDGIRVYAYLKCGCKIP